MKRIVILFAMFLFAMMISAQTTPDSRWDEYEIALANTGLYSNYLSKKEKDIILYINLARMHPKEFYNIEVRNYQLPEGYIPLNRDNPYLRSLEKTLKNGHPLPPVYPDRKLTSYAKYLAKEQGENGETGHYRDKGPKSPYYYLGECNNYGEFNSRGHVIVLLIDDGITSLGHRRNVLDKYFTLVGVGCGSHPVYGNMCVIDFAAEDE